MDSLEPTSLFGIPDRLSSNHPDRGISPVRFSCGILKGLELLEFKDGTRSSLNFLGLLDLGARL